MTIRIIDIETTGIDPSKDKIVEIASVDASREGRPTRPTQHLVNPGIPIPPLSSAVHHIVDAEVRLRRPIEAITRVLQNYGVAAGVVRVSKKYAAKFGSDKHWSHGYSCRLLALECCFQH